MLSGKLRFDRAAGARDLTQPAPSRPISRLEA
jgi:DNA-binding transcriptional LysR family regulator